jgi:hypothetical protein
LRIIPIPGVSIVFDHANADDWSARVTHPRAASSCAIHGSRAPRIELNWSAANAFCASLL